MIEIAGQAVKQIKKTGISSEIVVTNDQPPIEAGQEISFILPYNYEMDSNANGVFDEEDQNHLKIFLTALSDLVGKTGRQRFG